MPRRRRTAILAAMQPWLAWAVLLLGWILPLLHVLLSPKSGPWMPPAGGGCPLGPRPGWLTLVLLLGPLGWLMYMKARRAKGRGPASPT